ncbi:MAG: hypothetical protein Q7R64_02130, partial [bacterium]|nr:hypothetical protein [bacterium]
SQKIVPQNRVHRIGIRTPSVSPLEKPALNTTPNNTLRGGEGGTTEREREAHCRTRQCGVADATA